MRRILCLYLPNWPIQRVLAGRRVHECNEMHQEASAKKASQVHFASLMHPTTILHTRDPRRGLVVVAANDAATSAGVRVGMPLAEATTQVVGTLRVPSPLNGTRSVPTTLPHDPAADLAELARLAEHCERFSPLVGWETVESQIQSSKFNVQSQRPSTLNFEPGTLNSLFLDITGIGVLFGGEEQLAREAVADLARLGYTAQAAVADTIGAAWALASQRSEVGGQRSENELGTKYSVLSTQYQVLLHPNSPPLAPSPQPLALALPLAALRLPPETLDLLSQLGITRLAELLTLPRASLRARFGERLLLRLDQLTGAAQETIVAHRPPPKFAAEWVLEYPAERREIASQIVCELVGRVALALAQRREGVVQLHCRLDCGMGQRDACPTKIDVGLFRPSADARHLWDLLRMQLEQTRLPGPVGRVTLQALTTAPLENRQGELFAGGKDEADRQLALLIDRLASRLGPEAVLRPQLTADPLPERAARLRSTKYEVRSTKGKPGKTGSSFVLRPSSFSFRPLFLRSPLVLDAVSVVPDGPPITFHYQGQQHRVAFHWGPERIETGWFRGASVRRDYYRVQTEEGLRFWLFRRLDDEKWCLHAEFS